MGRDGMLILPGGRNDDLDWKKVTAALVANIIMLMRDQNKTTWDLCERVVGEYLAWLDGEKIFKDEKGRDLFEATYQANRTYISEVLKNLHRTNNIVTEHILPPEEHATRMPNPNLGDELYDAFSSSELDEATPDVSEPSDTPPEMPT